MRNRGVRLGATLACIATAWSTFVAPAPAGASPAGEAAAVTSLQQTWSRMTMQQRLGTCNAYRRNANVMVNAAAETAWSRPATRKGLSKPAWHRVYRTYFDWACAGAGRSPRP